jgi:hypothetical protein
MTHALAPILAQSGSSFRPFLDPLDLHDAWWLTLIPLALLISAAYKAVRVETFDGYWKHVLVMTAQVVIAMAGLSAALFLFVELAIPALGG